MRTLYVAFFVLLFLSSHLLGQNPDKHSHIKNKKHPTTLDSLRFLTTRKSEVSLPLPEEKEAFTFIVFGDRTGGPAEGIEVLKDAVRDANLFEPDLVMTVGDMIQGYNQTEEWMPQMREYKSVMSGLLCPWFPVAGNHDVYWRGSNCPEGQHEKSYEIHFGPLWYAFEHKDCWFIALYSDEGNPETKEKTFTKPECQRMSPEQFHWLKDTLEKARDAKHIFLFLHHPRWLGERYGDDWNKVHQALADAGNVSCVFAGHIHHMRYDGPKDNVEYMTLATVGGGQSFSVPKAGHLHQYHVVTVREEQIAIASMPVGEVMDVRALTGQLVTEVEELSRLRPVFETVPRILANGQAATPLKLKITNPVNRPVEIMVTVASEDARWNRAPDHLHVVLEPGRSEKFRFDLSRNGVGADPGVRYADIVINMDYLGEKVRIPIPEIRVEIPLKLELPAPEIADNAILLDGNDCLAIPHAMLHVPDGPLTLECWFMADSYGSRVGLVTKTQSSEYGFFVNKGVPEFDIFLDGAYAQARADELVLNTKTWHHLAGVYDGAEVRLYVDGALVSSVIRSGKRGENTLPLLIGADVDRRGRGMSHFNGKIDTVRLSNLARYQGESFKPEMRLKSDENTVLLLNMDGFAGPWIHDASASSAHARLIGDPKLVERN